MKSLKTIVLSTLFIFALSIAKGQSFFSNINKAADDVKAALATGNTSTVKAKAQALSLALAQPQKISTSQRRTFGAYVGVLMEEARHISETLVISHQQEHYNLFMKEWTEAEAKLKIK